MIQYDIPFQEYLLIPAMNQSTLKHGLKSMLQLRHAIDSPPKPETKPMRVGSGAQSLLEVGPDRFHKAYAVMPDLHLADGNVDAKGRPSNSKNTVWYKSAKYAWLDAHDGLEVVSRDEYDRILGIVNAVQADPIAGKMVRGAKHEVTLTFDMDGAECKARIDLLGDGWFADTKTTLDIEAVAFGRKFASFGYGFQMAFYDAALRANGLDCECHLITVESAPPHDVAVVPISDIELDPYRAQVRRVLEAYARASDTDCWPGVACGKPYELCISNWAMRDEDLLDWEGEA